MNAITTDLPNLCFACHHRADVPRVECDCLKCTAVRVAARVFTADHEQQPTRVIGRGIRAGAMTTSVTDQGITRRLDDADVPDFWIEIHESRARAIEVFKALWHHLTADERAEFTMWSWSPGSPEQPSGK
jgi:hypothetical protein